MAEAPEPDHADPRAGPDAPAPQRLPDGDPGAHQRSDGGGVEPGRAVVDEALADDVRRRPPAQGGRAVDPVATAVRERREVHAHVLVAGPAHAALAAGVDDVADGDRVADREARHVRADGRDLADELVARHEGHVAASLRRSAQRVQVGVADAAVGDPDLDVVGSQRAALEVEALDLPGGGRRAVAGGGSHGPAVPPRPKLPSPIRARISREPFRPPGATVVSWRPAGHRTERDDTVLLALVAEGDTAALEELYRRHSAWLFARLMRRCNDSDVVVDVLQDTFVAVWKDARRYRGDGEVAGWLWGIAFRRMVSQAAVAQGRRAPPRVGRLRPGRSPPAAEDEVLLGVEYGDLAGALRRLSPEFRSVVQAVVLDGLTTKEAGRLLGVRENTVKTRLHRAKRTAARRPHRPDRRDGDDHPRPGTPTATCSRRTSPAALDAIEGASVEQHLARCAECRTAIRPLVDAPLLERAWAAIRDAVESPPLPLAVRLARRLRAVRSRPSVAARATASLRTAWLVSAFVALAFATLAVGTGRRRRRWRPSCSSRRSSRCSASPPPTARTRTRSSRWS